MWKSNKNYSKWLKNKHFVFEVAITSAKWQIWQHKIVSMAEVSQKLLQKILVSIHSIGTLFFKKVSPQNRPYIVGLDIMCGIPSFIGVLCDTKKNFYSRKMAFRRRFLARKT